MDSNELARHREIAEELRRGRLVMRARARQIGEDYLACVEALEASGSKGKGVLEAAAAAKAAEAEASALREREGALEVRAQNAEADLAAARQDLEHVRAAVEKAFKEDGEAVIRGALAAADAARVEALRRIEREAERLVSKLAESDGSPDAAEAPAGKSRKR